jgi:hypothetical protein
MVIARTIFQNRLKVSSEVSGQFWTVLSELTKPIQGCTKPAENRSTGSEYVAT